jgi:hypothetical protein
MNQDVDGLLVRSVELLLMPAGRDRAIAYDGSSGRTFVLSELDGIVLSHCREGATLVEHARRITRLLGGAASDSSRVHGALSRLTDRGLLVSQGALIARAMAAAAPDHKVRLDAMAIITRDRLESLQRCLASHVGQAAAAGRHPAVLVVDGSTDRPTGRRCKALLEQTLRSARCRPLYLDRVGKRALADQLARTADVRPEVARFGLLDTDGVGFDAGANRNAVLLALAGRAFLSADDDTVAELSAPYGNGTSAALALSASPDPTQVRLYLDQQAAERAVRPLAPDLFQAHEGLLGRPVTTLMQAASSIDLEPMSTPVWRTLLTGQARVAATFPGLVGDSGARHATFYLWRPEVREQLLEARSDYRQLVCSRQIVRCAPRPTITESGLAMSTSFAADNRELLPPFFPVSRGEDLVFGQVLRLCFDHRLLAHLPFTLAHRPLARPAARRDDIWKRAPRLQLYQLVAAALTAIAPALRNVAPGVPRMRALGRQLQELAAVPGPGFLEVVRPLIWRGVTRQLSEVEAASAGLPPSLPWLCDWKRFAAAQLAQLRSQRGMEPADVQSVRSPASSSLPRAQHLIGRYGRLLEAWPALWAEARRLGDRGSLGAL